MSIKARIERLEQLFGMSTARQKELLRKNELLILPDPTRDQIMEGMLAGVELYGLETLITKSLSRDY